MRYRYGYSSRRSAKRLAQNSRRNFFITLVLIGILIYATINWVLPYFIGGIGFIRDTVKPPKKTAVSKSENSALAPPVFNIPYEATNSSEIDIRGFGTPGSKVKLYIDDESKQITDVSSDGSFTFKEIDLSIGINNIYGKTLDDQDKTSLSSKTIKLIYDNEKPPLDVSEPEDNKKIQGGDKRVKVSGVTDPETKVFINGSQIIVNSDGNFSTNFAIDEGDNILSVKAIDIANNSTEIQRRVNYTP